MKSVIASVFSASLVASGLAQVTIDLGTAADFALVAVGGVNNLEDSPTSIVGNVATTGHTVNGFQPGAIKGAVEQQNAAADQARADALAVYNQLHPLQGTQVVTTPDGTVQVIKGQGDAGGNGTTNFTGAVFTPGIYNVFSILDIITNVTLDGAGQFIFTSGSHFRMAPNSEVILTGGATLDNVWFVAGDSANVSNGAIFQGNLLSDSALFMENGAVSHGHMLLGGLVNLTDANINLA